VSADRKFTPSSVLDTGQSYQRTFDRAGSFPYFCSLHPTMTGTVVVRA
jgi:plastocyanin